MSSRVTRASARLSTAARSPTNPPVPQPPPPTPSTANRKRKAPAAREAGLDQTPSSAEPQPRKRAKRGSKAGIEEAQNHTLVPARKTRSARSSGVMSSTSQPAPPEESTAGPSMSKRKTSSKKKDSKKGTCFDIEKMVLIQADVKEPVTKSRSKASKKSLEPPPPPKAIVPSPDTESDEDESDENEDNYDEDEMEENEAAEFERTFGAASGDRFATAIRSIHGHITRTAADLRIILDNLRRRDDPTAQRSALEELAQTLLMANEDTLAGHFNPDPYVKELIPLMEPSEIWGENPEMALIACRCMANMMEALPASTANIVYGGAVPVLCKKLLEIHYIDVAEQALSVSEISIGFYH
jgi:E3 ubiquitin-protein ligase TRIP12